MAESRQHIELVKSMAEYVNCNYSDFNLLTDITTYPGDNESPPSIGDYDFKPDLYAFSVKEKHFIVGEAKTSYDLKSRRSSKQISNFLLYLNDKEISSFILSVPYSSSYEAKWMLNVMFKQLNLSLNECIIWDECDFWKLGDSGWDFI